MDSNYPARLRPGASRDPRRAGRANQGAGHDDRQQHHYRIQQYQHQSQHHHQVSYTLQKCVLPTAVSIPPALAWGAYLMIFTLHLMPSTFSSCSSTRHSHIVYAIFRMNPFDQPLTNNLETYRAARP